ncbi:DNA repair protein RecO [Gluconobacter wancherniae]|uniref:DNA repair protein RecO n=1 Tax=Gluconobacter wancherniae TaxID=1307955 RepID=UPI001B8B57C2|nr:DNA repair protein RecO [Gluconobacter wancherniae]MBS1088986.1 DNA repair protein RecO [Gluconobacter wancherniae]
MEWEAAVIVLSVRPYGETSVLVHLFSEEHGVCHGVVRGGASRRQASLWQTGNLVMAHWRARLVDQLGTVSAELVQSPAARVLDLPIPLGMISSACALTDGALPERESHPELFMELIRLLTLVGVAPEPPPMAPYLRWECLMLEVLGYGLDLERCAVTGMKDNLCYVSPRTGCSVSDEGAGTWKNRLLPLPRLFIDPDDDGDAQGWKDGMLLTGHFLARSVFGVRNLPLPSARERLYERIVRLCPPIAGEGALVDGLEGARSDAADDIGVGTVIPD